MKDVLLGFVTGPTVGMWFMRSVLMLFKSDPDSRFTADFIISMGPYIHQNRNELQQFFMESDRDWLFMVDNDMVFDPEDVFALLEEADKLGPGIYSAPYVMENGAYVCGPWSTEMKKVYHPLVEIPDQTCRIGMVGTGFTLVHRKVFEAIGPDAFSPLQYEEGDKFTFFGEDVSLCWKAMQHDFIPWLVPAARPGHTKSIVMYHKKSTTNLQGADVDLVKVDPTNLLFQRRTSEEGK